MAILRVVANPQRRTPGLAVERRGANLNGSRSVCVRPHPSRPFWPEPPYEYTDIARD
jgi:hypothetical protein